MLITKAYEADLTVAPGERAVVAAISTDAVDRVREVVLPRGGRFDRFERNPVVLLDHGKGSSLPIGRCVSLKVEDNRIVAKTVFLDASLNPTADQVFRMYQAGVLNSFSIGFAPIDGSPPTARELKGRPDWSGCKKVWREWEMAEYSAVAVPANPEAVAVAVSKGLTLPDWLQSPSLDPNLELPPLVGRTFAEARAFARAAVRQMAADVLQDRLDYLRGKL